ncbi:hypothetical protein SAMN04488121_1021070 [Chitinophaga filiformis]|uniref:Uncharacterized protein n=1 Tax=Chitinophaga filiformis TaxID=104663 RepID=A0A1G7P5E2_CHIFI|nr:hypothetical protein SAMN04488121_1021070 [Chitinophaga filiformis]
MILFTIRTRKPSRWLVPAAALLDMINDILFHDTVDEENVASFQIQLWRHSAYGFQEGVWP